MNCEVLLLFSKMTIKGNLFKWDKNLFYISGQIVQYFILYFTFLFHFSCTNLLLLGKITSSIQCKNTDLIKVGKVEVMDFKEI